MTTMKQNNLYLIGGPMGVGKTTVCRELQSKLSQCAFLDGDWCWDTDPFMVTSSTKKMVVDNIVYMLNSFITCPDINNIVFCWIMHEQSVIDSILSGISTEDYGVHIYTLICDEGALISRLEKDVANGLRSSDIFERSLDRLKKCSQLQSTHIDTSNLSPSHVADSILCKRNNLDTC